MKTTFLLRVQRRSLEQIVRASTGSRVTIPTTENETAAKKKTRNDMETGWVKVLWAIVKSDAASLGAAGVAGAVSVAMVEWDGWFQLARKVAVGLLCALYLSPIAVPILGFFLDGINVGRENAPTLGGFIMGMIGIVFIEFLLHIIRARKTMKLAERGHRRKREPSGPPAGFDDNVAPDDEEIGDEGGE